MNFCPFKKDIIAYRMGLLSGSKRTVFEEHLRTCTLCQQEIEIEGAMDEVLSERHDPGDIEVYILSRVRLLRNMQPKTSWTYFFKVGAYIAAASTLLWIVVPMIMSLLTAGGQGIAKILEGVPTMPQGLINLLLLGTGIVFALMSGILTWRTIRE
jgi:hypothetical protein